MSIVYHKPIASQACVAIVAPSGALIDDEKLSLGIKQLESLGFLVKNYYQPEHRFQRFGASDEVRLLQLNAALDNPDVHIVMALRGSYGMSRLLPHIDFKKIKKSGKLLVGFSDFNALQLALLAKEKYASLAGPMLGADFCRDELCEFTIAHFLKALRTRELCYEWHNQDSPALSAMGVLWGGNLAMLNHLIGTPYFPDIDNGILFVEDVGEHPYRIERMILQLAYTGILQKQKAILLGDFSDYRLAPHDRGYDFDAMLSYLRSVITTPIIRGLPFGHCQQKVSLVQGAMAQLSVNTQSVSLRMRF